MSMNGYRSKMAFKAAANAGTTGHAINIIEPQSAGIQNALMINGIQDDEAEIGPVDDDMEDD